MQNASMQTVSRITPRRIRYAVMTMAVVALASYAQMLPVLRTRLMEYLSVDKVRFGAIFSIGLLAGGLAALAGGALSDRFRPRAIIRGSLVGVAAACLVYALAGSRWMLFAAGAALVGAFYQSLCIATNAYLVRLFPRHRRRLLTISLVVMGGTWLVFPLWGELVLVITKSGEGLSFPVALHAPFAVVAVGLIAASFLYRPRRGAPTTPAETKAWHWRDMILPRRTAPLVTLAVLHGVADLSAYTWMALYLERAWAGTPPLPPGLALSGYAVANIAARLTLVFVPERRGRRAFLLLPGVLGGGAFIIGVLSGDYLLAMGGYVLGSLLWSIQYPAAMGVIADALPNRFGAAQALTAVLTMVFGAGVTLLMGLVAARVGDAAMWKAMLIPAALFPCCSVMGALWVLRGRRGESPTSPGSSSSSA